MSKTVIEVLYTLLSLNLVLIAPLIALCGLNFILETGGYPEIKYTLNSWFGCLIMLFAIRLKVR